MFQVTSHLVFGLSVLRVLISLLFFKKKLILIELDPNQEWGILVLKQKKQKKKTFKCETQTLFILCFLYFYYKMVTFYLSKKFSIT